MKKVIVALLSSSFCFAQITDRNELLATSLWIFQKSFFTAGQNLNGSLAWSIQRNDLDAACQSVFQIHGNSVSLYFGFNGVLKYFEMDFLLFPKEKIKKTSAVQRAYERYMNEAEKMGTECAKKTATMEQAKEFYEKSTSTITSLSLSTEELAQTINKK